MREDEKAERSVPSPPGPAVRSRAVELLDLGMAARRNQDHEAALRYFTAAATDQPRNLNVQVELAATLVNLARLEEAATCCEQVIRQAPGVAKARFLLGIIARQKNDHAQALAYFEAAADLNPQNLGYRLEVAQSLYNLRRHEESRFCCQKILEQEPCHARALSLLGIVAHTEKDYHSAVRYLRAASAIEPRHIEIKLRIARALQELGSLDEAEAGLRELLRDNPRNDRAVLALVGFLREKGANSEALDVLEEAERGLPENEGLMLEIGRVLHAQQRFDEAKSKFQAVLATSPNNYGAILGLAQVERSRMDWAAALVHFRRAAALRVDEPKICLDIAGMLVELVRVDEAERLLRECDQIPGIDRNDEYQIRKLRHYCETMAFDKAEEVAARWISAQDIPENVVGVVARLYAERGRWGDIIDLLRERIIANALPGTSAGCEMLLEAVAAAARRTGRYEDVLELTESWPHPGTLDMVSKLRDQIAEETLLLDSLGLSDGFSKAVRPQVIESPLRANRHALLTGVLSSQSPGPESDSLAAAITPEEAARDASRTIYYCTDMRYLLGAAVSLFSLLRHNPVTRRNCNFIVYCPSEGISTARRVFESTAACFGLNIDVRSTEYLMSRNHNLRTSWGSFTPGLRLSEAAYYRIYAARQLLHEKGLGRALYIDSDTCVGPGIEALLDFDLAGLPMGARLDTLSVSSILRATLRLGIEKGKYFNSGVLLFDLAHPELERGLDRSIDASLTKQHLLSHLDQCALNLGFENATASLPDECNFFIRLKDDSLGSARPTITHFVAHPKPWDPRYDSENCMIWFHELAAFAKVLGADMVKELLKGHFQAYAPAAEARSL